jgi:hypothetical protein
VQNKANLARAYVTVTVGQERCYDRNGGVTPLGKQSQFRRLQGRDWEPFETRLYERAVVQNKANFPSGLGGEMGSRMVGVTRDKRLVFCGQLWEHGGVAEVRPGEVVIEGRDALCRAHAPEIQRF